MCLVVLTWIQFGVCSLYFVVTKSNMIGRTAWGDSHTILMIASCYEYPPMTASIERTHSLRRRYVSAAGTSMSVEECKQTLHSWRRFVLWTEAPEYMGFAVL